MAGPLSLHRLRALALVLMFLFGGASAQAAPGVCSDTKEDLRETPEQIVARLGMAPAILTFKRDAEDIPVLTPAIIKARSMQLPQQAGFAGEQPYIVFSAEIGVGALVAGVFDQSGPRSASLGADASNNGMAVGDAVYGNAPRYVSSTRLADMLAVHSQQMLNAYKDVNPDPKVDRRAPPPGSRFVAYADTAQVGANNPHAWIGVSFQAKPNGPLNTVKLHIVFDSTNPYAQRKQLAQIGINLIYGSYRFTEALDRLVSTLRDGIKVSDLTIDAIEMSGPDFPASDATPQQRAVATVHSPLAGTAPTGEAFVPSEHSYGKTIVYAFGNGTANQALQAMGAGTPNGPLVVRVVKTTAAAALDPSVGEALQGAHGRGEIALLATADAKALAALEGVAAAGGPVPKALSRALGGPAKIYILNDAGALTELANGP